MACGLAAVGDTGEVSAPTLENDLLDDPAPAPRSGGLGVRGWLRWSWNLLTSMRTALILLLLLVLAAIPGSVFPQRVADPLAVSAFVADNPDLAPVLDRLGMFDVYGSVWFSAIYVLLFISLVGCVIPRVAKLWRQWRDGPAEPPRALSRRSDARRVPSADARADLADMAERLSRERWRVRRDHDDRWLSAEKGFLREVGNLGFHLSMIAVLLAVAVGSLWGWRGNVVLREGTGFSNTLTQYDNWGGGRMVDPGELTPFSLGLESFTVEFERGDADRGAPRDFEAVTTVREDLDDPGRVQVLRVNEPIVLDGTKIFLIGHGYAPHLRVTDSDGRVRFDDTVVFLPQDSQFTSTGVVKIPDANPQRAYNGLFAPTAELDETGPHSVFPAPDLPVLFLSAFTGDLGLDAGVPQNVYDLDTSTLTQIGLEAIGPGQTWTLSDGSSVEFVGFERWISLQVSHDPGRWWALVGAGLILTGLAISLLVPRRRIWVRRIGDGPGESLVLAGLARSESARPEDEVAELAAGVTPPAPGHGAATDASSIPAPSNRGAAPAGPTARSEDPTVLPDDPSVTMNSEAPSLWR